MDTFKKKTENMLERFKELEKKLADHDLMKDMKKYKEIAREHSSLKDVVLKVKEYGKIERDISNMNEIINGADKDMTMYAQGEKNELSERMKFLEEEIKLFLNPGDKNDGKNVLVEIRAGTGGEEAALFAGDLFRMYSRYAESKGWKTSIISVNETGLKGLKEVIFSIEGTNVYKFLKHESGVHRVQRVPLTEASGRIHTSAVTVAVLPEAEEIELEIKNEDLRIDTYCSSGKGGQSVNTTYSAVRITHLATNIVVQCQDERSQLRNKQKAMMVLRSKLMDKAISEQQSDVAADRKKKVGTGDRSEKIRTYNFPQDRITDHRINFSMHNMESVLEGNIDELVKKLSLEAQKEDE